MEELKAKARKLGLWNLFLPRNHFSQGAGFSNLEYGLMAEYLGKSTLAPEVRYPTYLPNLDCDPNDVCPMGEPWH